MTLQERVSKTVWPSATAQEDLIQPAGVAGVWERKIHGEGVTVAVLDSGVREDRLGDRLVWSENLTDDPGPNDTLGHGTEMAAFIVGFAPKAKVASIKVIDEDGVTRDRVIRALELCAKRSAEIGVVNVSLGIRRRFWRWTSCKADRLCTLCTKTNELARAGLMIVVAAGNLGPGPDTLTCPAMAADALSVGASAVTAPGLVGGFLARHFTSFYYGLGEGSTGTSVSAALTSGGVALLVSAFPDVTLAEIKDATQTTATRQEGEDGPREVHWYRTYKLIDHRRRGQTFDPRLGYTHYQAGLELRKGGNDARSIAEFEAAVSLAPTSAYFYNELGRAYLAGNAIERSFAAFQEAVRLHWKLAAAHNNLALVFERLHRWKEAQAHYETALSFDPDSAQVQSNLERVRRVLGRIQGLENAGAIVV